MPAAAKATQAPANTDRSAGGSRPKALGAEFPSPPPGDVESNAYALSEGQRLYQRMNCAACHAVNGGGAIGPALSDDAWIYGWQPQVIFDSIVHGRPNGMPAFSGRIPDYQVWQMVAYVRSLSGLTSAQAAPGRSDEMSGTPPPNSIRRAHPESSTSQLEELRWREQLEFARRGWVDPRSGEIRIPDDIVKAVAQQK